ncbi:MAG TPA: gpW family head-tail joining protein [Blastocatellia bacterium]|jgi:hypothetical protein|nr:gpW family head-tail joining protein [Blastocatellia bacterium]
MPCNRRPNPIPLPCQQLADAQAQMGVLMRGQNISAIETPQLGRVEYEGSQTAIGDLQRYIDKLTAECALARGDLTAFYRSRRRPVSMEAMP